MPNFSGIARAQAMKFDVLLKPTGMSKKLGKVRPEFQVTVDADSRDEAARLARAMAANCGFNGYAISKVKEVRI